MLDATEKIDFLIETEFNQDKYTICDKLNTDYDLIDAVFEPTVKIHGQNVMINNGKFYRRKECKGIVGEPVKLVMQEDGTRYGVASKGKRSEVVEILDTDIIPVIKDGCFNILYREAILPTTQRGWRNDPRCRNMPDMINVVKPNRDKIELEQVFITELENGTYEEVGFGVQDDFYQFGKHGLETRAIVKHGSINADGLIINTSKKRDEFDKTWITSYMNNTTRYCIDKQIEGIVFKVTTKETVFLTKVNRGHMLTWAKQNNDVEVIRELEEQKHKKIYKIFI